MEKHLCHNITSSQNNYSAPVPFIGLYVAGASLVCFLLMISDVIHGIRHKKVWLPCRWFSLNSVTLTLLSVVAKLPVDLTTPMPGAWDQLSKLTGTAFICVSMGVLLPSLGTNSASESVTNTAALSIFVITIIVNTCIQISTGVIFSFIPEHVIIMFLMLAMLTFLWMSTWITNMDKEIQMDKNEHVFKEGRVSVTMVQRLKLCYLHGYNSDPQLKLCTNSNSFSINVICLSCIAVVLQVSLRTVFGHDFNHCNEVSDYGWSIRMIVGTQILVILLSSLSASFRVLFIHNYKHDVDPVSTHEETDGAKGNEPFLGTYAIEDENVYVYFLRYVVNAYVVMAWTLLILPFLVVLLISAIAAACLDKKNTKPDDIQEYRELSSENEIVIQDWILTSCAQDIRKWMSRVQTENNSLCHLTQLLSKTSPSSQSLEQLYRRYNFTQENEVSCLYLIFLVRIASVSIPSSLSGHLTPIISEVFDIVRFVDTKINSLSFNSRKKCRLAKAMWMGKDFSIVVPKVFEGRNRLQLASSDLDRALTIIRELKNVLPPCFIWNEVGFIMDFINGREYTTIEELFSCMEQLFVDMLYIFLIQLPYAISKEVTESPAEEYMEKVGLMLKIISKVEILKGKVPCSFPIGSNIISLVPTPTSITEHHNNTTGNDDSNVASTLVIEDDEHNVIDNACHVEISEA